MVFKISPPPGTCGAQRRESRSVRTMPLCECLALPCASLPAVCRGAALCAGCGLGRGAGWWLVAGAQRGKGLYVVLCRSCLEISRSSAALSWTWTCRTTAGGLRVRRLHHVVRAHSSTPSPARSVHWAQPWGVGWALGMVPPESGTGSMWRPPLESERGLFRGTPETWMGGATSCACGSCRPGRARPCCRGCPCRLGSSGSCGRR